MIRITLIRTCDPRQTLTLANGTSLTAPGTGDQQVPIHVVENDNDYVLGGWFNCTKLDQHVTDLFASDAFTNYQKEHQPLLETLAPRFGRPLILAEMWNMYVYQLLRKARSHISLSGN